MIGCFNVIYGIAAIANSHVFTADARYVFGSLNSWASAALGHHLVISARAQRRRGGGGWGSRYGVPELAPELAAACPGAT